MTSKAIDPFEEFLRKKKVELLEQKYRVQREKQQEEEAVSDNPDDDPETEARLQEEMDEFFQEGQSAAAQLYDKVKSLSEEKVDEIKDALDDVFEDDAAVPEKVEEDDDAADTFVNFFKQVQEEFDEDEDDGSASISHLAITDEPEPEPEPLPVVEDFASAAAEISTDAKREGVKAVRTESRLDLADLLLRPAQDEADLKKRLEVLCRLVTKLVERSDLPESEIVEALIKSGIEF